MTLKTHLVLLGNFHGNLPFWKFPGGVLLIHTPRDLHLTRFLRAEDLKKSPLLKIFGEWFSGELVTKRVLYVVTQSFILIFGPPLVHTETTKLSWYWNLACIKMDPQGFFSLFLLHLHGCNHLSMTPISLTKKHTISPSDTYKFQEIPNENIYKLECWTDWNPAIGYHFDKICVYPKEWCQNLMPLHISPLILTPSQTIATPPATLTTTR